MKHTHAHADTHTHTHTHTHTDMCNGRCTTIQLRRCSTGCWDTATLQYPRPRATHRKPQPPCRLRAHRSACLRPRATCSRPRAAQRVLKLALGNRSRCLAQGSQCRALRRTWGRRWQLPSPPPHMLPPLRWSGLALMPRRPGLATAFCVPMAVLEECVGRVHALLMLAARRGGCAR